MTFDFLNGTTAASSFSVDHELRVQRTFESGRAALLRNNVQQAISIAKSMQQHAREHPRVYHLLGLIALHRKNWSGATQLFASLATGEPENPEYQIALARCADACGELEQCLGHLSSAIISLPDRTASLDAAAECLDSVERNDRAKKFWTDLQERHPLDPAIAAHTAIACTRVGDWETALPLLLQAYSSSPRSSYVVGRIDVAIHDDPSCAIAFWRALQQIFPRDEFVLLRLGSILHTVRKLDDAEAVLLPVTTKTHDPRFWIELAGIAGDRENDDLRNERLMAADQLIEQRLAALRRTVYRCRRGNQPRFLPYLKRFEGFLLSNRSAILVHRGYVASRYGKFDDSLNFYNQSLKLWPSNTNAKWNRSMVLLHVGRCNEGWQEYEARQNQLWFHLRHVRENLWGGEPLYKKTLLVYAEQGAGDVFQFIRYAAILGRRGAKVIVGCAPNLRSIVSLVPGISGTVVPGEITPAHDYQAMMMSLPKYLYPAEKEAGDHVPYIAPPIGAVERWRELLGPRRSRLRVGLVWAGNKNFADDARRSTTFESLAPLARLTDIEFFTLQIGYAAEQIKQAGHGLRVTDLTSEIKDYIDTAAFISNLDLIVGTDTGVVHLGGAMGKPIWVALNRFADWRWFLDRQDSPWYPTMRLFRQHELHAWTPLFEQIAQSLETFSPDFSRSIK